MVSFRGHFPGFKRSVVRPADIVFSALVSHDTAVHQSRQEMFRKNHPVGLNPITRSGKT